MLKTVPLFIGLRYIRAKRRNQFISFISGFSLLGMALGVMALITVLSVMNGFDRELKSRILSVVPHIELQTHKGLSDWSDLTRIVEQDPQVLASAPYIQDFAMVGFQGSLQGVQLRGIEPTLESTVSVVEQRMFLGSTQQLEAGRYGIVMGKLLARQLRLNIGDKVTLTLPQVSVTPAGIYPRVKRFTLVGVFDTGSQLDQSLVMAHLSDTQKLLRMKDRVHGLRIKTSDMHQSAKVAARLAKQLNQDTQSKYQLRDWSQTQGSLFDAVKMEKAVIGTLLMIIVAVAAFNIISSLVLMVADKRSDIAVLRTMGLSQNSVMQIFVVQGFGVGLMGIAIGGLLGVVMAFNVASMVAWIESVTGLFIFDPSVYYITKLPSHLMVSDVVLVICVAISLSLFATLYPAWRASRIQPAEALRYE